MSNFFLFTWWALRGEGYMAIFSLWLRAGDVVLLFCNSSSTSEYCLLIFSIEVCTGKLHCAINMLVLKSSQLIECITQQNLIYLTCQLFSSLLTKQMTRLRLTRICIGNKCSYFLHLLFGSIVGRL